MLLLLLILSLLFGSCDVHRLSKTANKVTNKTNKVLTNTTHSQSARKQSTHALLMSSQLPFACLLSYYSRRFDLCLPLRIELYGLSGWTWVKRSAPSLCPRAINSLCDPYVRVSVCPHCTQRSSDCTDSLLLRVSLMRVGV